MGKFGIILRKQTGGGGTNLGTKTVTQNGVYNASSDNLDGYTRVTVSVPEDVLVAKTITANGTYNPADDSVDGYSSVVVSIPTATGVSF